MGKLKWRKLLAQHFETVFQDNDIYSRIIPTNLEMNQEKIKPTSPIEVAKYLDKLQL